jgi:glycosyltransferase involved in cell wall biosynthesis
VVELLDDPERRRELGEAGREFALKWHSAQAGARRLDAIYSELLETR